MFKESVSAGALALAALLSVAAPAAATVDGDLDTYLVDVDCDDTDPAVNPGAPEVPDNTVDENCDGVVAMTPVAADGSATTAEDTPVDIALAAAHADGAARTVTALPAFGTLYDGTVAVVAPGTLLSGDTVRYEPARNWSGSDAFRFTVAGAASDAEVAVTVTPVVDATSIKYNGPTSVRTKSSLKAKANLNSTDPACVGAQRVTFTLDRNPLTGAAGAYSLGGGTTRLRSGQAYVEVAVPTSGWRVGTYKITASYAGNASCSGSTGTSALKVTR